MKFKGADIAIALYVLAAFVMFIVTIPSGLLDVLLANNIHDTVVVVTRYFGGTLLGTGGLVRAYSQAVRQYC